MTRPRTSRFAVVATTAAVAFSCAVACDRNDGKAAPPPPAAVDPYDRYAMAVSPLVEALKKMKELLLTREGTQTAPFEHHYSTIRTELLKAEPSVTAEDRQRDSWKAAMVAVDELKVLQAGMTKLIEVTARADEMERAQRLGVRLEIPPKRLVEDLKTLHVLPGELAKIAADVGGDIVRCETALAQRR